MAKKNMGLFHLKEAERQLAHVQRIDSCGPAHTEALVQAAIDYGRASVELRSTKHYRRVQAVSNGLGAELRKCRR